MVSPTTFRLLNLPKLLLFIAVLIGLSCTLTQFAYSSTTELEWAFSPPSQTNKTSK